MRLDVFTLFPEWFDWFLTQRHVRNLVAAGSELRFVDYRETTPLGAPKPVVNEHRDIGRNDPCWCGSGKKFKRCHGA